MSPGIQKRAAGSYAGRPRVPGTVLLGLAAWILVLGGCGASTTLVKSDFRSPGRVANAFSNALSTLTETAKKPLQKKKTVTSTGSQRILLSQTTPMPLACDVSYATTRINRENP